MMYGSPFPAQFGTADDGTWAAVLGGITPDQLARGLNACVERTARNLREGRRDYPPAANEFRALCLTEPAGERERAATPTVAALEDNRTIEQRVNWARPFLQTLRAACRGRRVMDRVVGAVVADGLDFYGQPAGGDA